MSFQPSFSDVLWGNTRRLCQLHTVYIAPYEHGVSGAIKNANRFNDRTVSERPVQYPSNTPGSIKGLRPGATLLEKDAGSTPKPAQGAPSPRPDARNSGKNGCNS